MKQIILYVFLVAVVGLLTSCDLALTREETAVIPIADGPTITAFLCPQDTVHRVRVSYTQPAIGISEEAKFRQELKKAVVELSQGGRSVTLAFDSIYQVFLVQASQFSFVAGDKISLVVKIPGRPNVESFCNIPLSIVDSSSILLEKVPVPSGDTFYRARWRDIPDQTNYYAFWMLRTGYDSRSGTFSVQQELARLPLDDRTLIEGDVATDPFSFDLTRRASPNGSYERAEALVCHTDENYYNYHRLLAQIQRDPSPFAEPIRLPTNIRGGYGMMAGYTRVRLLL